MKKPLYKRVFRNRMGLIGISLLGVFFAVYFLSPWLARPEKPCANGVFYFVPDWLYRPFFGEPPCQPYKMPRDGFGTKPIPPDWSAWRTFPPDWRLHPLGTTERRYDIYYGLVWGTRTALSVGVVVVAFQFLFGLFVGATSGYYGGKVDGLLMRLCDLMFVLPGLLIILVIVSVYGRGLEKIVFASILFGWAGYARFIRGDVLSVRSRLYVDAARALGVNSPTIIRRHIIPNMIYPALILASLEIGTLTLALAGYSFLGLGSGEDYADWGAMIALARNRIVGTVGGNTWEFWYTVFFPGITIFLFVLAWNLMGDAVRAVLDPHEKG
jgi:peptide/nickel transport system permease protein